MVVPNPVSHRQHRCNSSCWQALCTCRLAKSARVGRRPRFESLRGRNEAVSSGEQLRKENWLLVSQIEAGKPPLPCAIQGDVEKDSPFSAALLMRKTGSSFSLPPPISASLKPHQASHCPFLPRNRLRFVAFPDYSNSIPFIDIVVSIRIGFHDSRTVEHQ